MLNVKNLCNNRLHKLQFPPNPVPPNPNYPQLLKNFDKFHPIFSPPKSAPKISKNQYFSNEFPTTH